jgi:hypothetical protein
MSLSIQPDFQVILTNFCQEATFKRYVRDAINTEFFWRDILQNLQFKNDIDNRVDSKMSDIKDKIRLSTTNLVNEKLELYTKSQLPNNILYELNRQLPDQLSKQLPAYLDTNHKMQTILNTHIDNLTTELYNSAKETLDKLTNEEQYHSITTSHLNSMAVRYNESVDNQLDKNNAKFNEQLSSHESKTNALIQDVISNVNKSLEKFDNFNKNADNMALRLTKLEKKIESMKNTTSSTQHYVMALYVIGILGICGMGLYFKK